MAAPMRGALKALSPVRATMFQLPLAATLLLSAAPPALSAPVNLVAPSISGTPETGQTLTRSPGSWSGNPIPSVGWQWTADGADIAGATANTLVLDVSLEGAVIGGYETATNSQGSLTAPSSNTLGPVTAPPPTTVAPSNTAAPSISGTAQVGQSLSRTAGTWDGTPAPSVAWQWTSDGADIAGQTGNVLPLTADLQGTIIGGYETATNSAGTDTANSNTLGPVAAAPAPPGALSTPTIAFDTDHVSGAAPDIVFSDADYMTGLYIEWEFDDSLTPAKDADGGYSTAAQHGVTFVDGTSTALNDLNLGYSAVTGPYSFHMRVLRDNPDGDTTVTDQFGSTATYDASAWSNDLSDTVVTSTAAFSTVTGVNKSTYLTVSNGNMTIKNTVNDGAHASDRVFPAIPGKFHFEATIDELNQSVAIGVTNDTVNMSGNITIPASTGTAPPGFSFRVIKNNAGATVYRNGSSVGVPLPGTTIGGASAPPAVGDTLIIEGDPTANPPSVTMLYRRASSGEVVTIRQFTMTPETTPAVWHAYGAAYKGDASFDDTITANFGASPFVVPPTSGYNGW